MSQVEQCSSVIDVQWYALRSKIDHRRKRHLNRRYVNKVYYNHGSTNNSSGGSSSNSIPQDSWKDQQDIFWTEDYSLTNTLSTDTNTETEESEIDMSVTNQKSVSISTHQKNKNVYRNGVSDPCPPPIRAIASEEQGNKPMICRVTNTHYPNYCSHIPGTMALVNDHNYPNHNAGVRNKSRTWSDVVNGSNPRHSNGKRGRWSKKKKERIERMKIRSMMERYSWSGMKNNRTSLHECFDVIDQVWNDSHSKHVAMRYLQLSHEFVLYFSQLYDPTCQSDVLSLLHSVRVIDWEKLLSLTACESHAQSLFGLGKEYIISVGVFVEELMEIINKSLSLCGVESHRVPVELASVICDFVGMPILGLNVGDKDDLSSGGKPWLNVIRWNSQIPQKNHTNTLHKKKKKKKKQE